MMRRGKFMLENTLRALTLCVPGLLLGCAAGVDDEMLAYVDDIKARPGGRIEALPQIKPYETFEYSADQLRSPFSPGRPDSSGSMAGPKPMQDRSKEYLEQFPLDTLAMVGTLDREGTVYGLVRTQDGMVHRVTSGNYVGQNDGRILAVSDSGIRLEELVSDGIGSFYKRSAEIGLND
jgi:type IV pilus assembly protein PilP